MISTGEDAVERGKDGDTQHRGAHDDGGGGKEADGVVSHARPGFTAFTCGTCVSHNARRPSDLASTVQSLP